MSVKSKIRVTFNRPLTYSEREHMRSTWEGDEEFYQARFSDSEKLYVEHYEISDSRLLFKSVADFVEAHYVNVHPVAVKTFTPEVKV